MGNNLSYDENIQNKHYDVDTLFNRINDEANRLINLISERKYTDRDTICSKLGYQKVDELSNSFSVTTLDGVRHRLGLISNHEELGDSKEQVCLDIVNFYMNKMNLITNIQKELPKCQSMERKIYENLKARLNSNTLTEDQWLKIYNQLQKFNDDIKTRYELIEAELEKIRKAKTMRDLDIISANVNNILNKTNSICKNYEKGFYSQRVVSPQVSPQSPTRQVTSQSPQAQSPRVHTVVRNVPVVQRTIINPTVVRHEVIENPVSNVVSVPNATTSFSQMNRIPPESFQEQNLRTSVNIKAENIRRTPVGLSIKNPSKIETTRTIPKEHAAAIHRSLKPGTKVVRIEPVYNRREKAIPVKAISSHTPLTRSEIELKEGQPTLYLGKSGNGWAKVRHADSREGYVPYSHLSL